MNNAIKFGIVALILAFASSPVFAGEAAADAKQETTAEATTASTNTESQDDTSASDDSAEDTSLSSLD